MAYDFNVSLRGATEGQMKANIMAIGTVTVPYTHLTLPTIYSV